MKKKILFGVLAVVLAIGLTIPMALVSAHEEGDPYVTDLLAGKFEDVGDVKVWNDGDNLYITYEISDLDWIITETHLYVGKNVAPTTAPGQFPYDDEDATSVSDTVVTYTIPLADIDSYSMKLNNAGKPTGVMVADGDPGVEPCNQVYIAAHSVVQKVEIETFTVQPELIWQRSAETAGAIAHFPGYGGQWDPETDGFVIPLDETQVVWDSGTYHTPPGTPTGSFASWNYKGAVGTQGPSYDSSYGSDLRRFHASFTMPDGCSVTGGTLSAIGFSGIPINDNVYVFVNEGLIFWGGTRANVLPTFEGMSGVQALRGATNPLETDRWYVPGTLPPLTNLVSGTNHIDVFTEENERWGGLGELVMSLECETIITTTETAWGGGFLFEGRNNWAMHFPYHVQVVPCMTPGGELTITGTGWKSVSAWCPCAYTYDLTDAGEPIALQGWVDLLEAAVANLNDWSKYYAKFSMFDSGGNAIEVVFCNDWLGPWYEMPAQQWDRIRMENNMGLTQPLRYYATVGGVLGYDMDGTWVGPGNGATVYPSDGNYFFQLIADPDAETFTLQVYGMGSGAPANPPDAWPKQNMYDYPTWLELGTITASGFDFSQVNICAVLWASTQAGEDDTTTIYWDGMVVDTPVTFGDIPA